MANILQMEEGAREARYGRYRALLEGDLSVWEFGRVIGSEEEAMEAWLAWKVVPDHCNCSNCQRPMRAGRDDSRGFGFRWVCRVEGHQKTNPRTGTFFENALVGPLEAARLLFHFLVKDKMTTAATSCHLTKTTTIDWYNFFREVADVVQDHDFQPIGGDHDVVEVDESHLFTRKYHRGRLLASERRGEHQTWVFGAFSRSSGDMWIETIPNKARVTLDRIMAGRIRRRSWIMSDEHRSYRGCDNRLRMKGHATVNHRYRFVQGTVQIRGVLDQLGEMVPEDPTLREVAVHTNGIERQWRELKKALATCRSLPRVPLYVGEFLFRRNILRHLPSLGQKMARFLEDIARVYPGKARHQRRVRRPGQCACERCQPPAPPRRRNRQI